MAAHLPRSLMNVLRSSITTSFGFLDVDRPAVHHDRSDRSMIHAENSDVVVPVPNQATRIRRADPSLQAPRQVSTSPPRGLVPDRFQSLTRITEVIEGRIDTSW